MNNNFIKDSLELDLITNLSLEIGYSKQYIKMFFCRRNEKFYDEQKTVSFLGMGKQQIIINNKNVEFNKNIKKKAFLELRKHLSTLKNNMVTLEMLKNSITNK